MAYSDGETSAFSTGTVAVFSAAVVAIVCVIGTGDQPTKECRALQTEFKETMADIVKANRPAGGELKRVEATINVPGQKPCSLSYRS